MLMMSGGGTRLCQAFPSRPPGSSRSLKRKPLVSDGVFFSLDKEESR